VEKNTEKNIGKIPCFFLLKTYKQNSSSYFMEINNFEQTKNQDKVIIIKEPQWMIILKKLIERNKVNIKKSEQLNTTGGQMVTKLPEFKGYTMDEKLGQFRKVDREKPSIEFVDFDSEEGQELLAEYEDSQYD
jgi:hypothetical protein